MSQKNEIDRNIPGVRDLTRTFPGDRRNLLRNLTKSLPNPSPRIEENAKRVMLSSMKNKMINQGVTVGVGRRKKAR